MKKSRRKPGRAAGRAPVQFFTYGPLEFNVNKAVGLAADAAKYPPQTHWPAREWVGPYIDIDEGHIERADLAKPVIFATFIRDGYPSRVLIDGNHRVLKALNHRLPVSAVVLDLEDTFKIMKGPGPMIEQMRRDAQ